MFYWENNFCISVIKQWFNLKVSIHIPKHAHLLLGDSWKDHKLWTINSCRFVCENDESREIILLLSLVLYFAEVFHLDKWPLQLKTGPWELVPRFHHFSTTSFAFSHISALLKPADLIAHFLPIICIDSPFTFFLHPIIRNWILHGCVFFQVLYVFPGLKWPSTEMIRWICHGRPKSTFYTTCAKETIDKIFSLIRDEYKCDYQCLH